MSNCNRRDCDQPGRHSHQDRADDRKWRKRRGPDVCAVDRCWALPAEACMFPGRLACARRAKPAEAS